MFGFPARTIINLGLYGFVFHVIFGKAYALIPAYFERTLWTPWGPRIQLPLTATGTLLLAVDPALTHGISMDVFGRLLWASGALVFLVTLLATIGSNLSGAATGTGDANAQRRHVDRYANAFVPFALAYFAIATYDNVAIATGIPPILDGLPAQTSHLLAAGTGGLLILAIGARLLPRFFVANPPRPLVAIMLPAGAIGPMFLASGIRTRMHLLVGGFLMTIAIVSYFGVVITLAVTSSRRRIGLITVLIGAIGGVLGVFAGLLMAFDSSVGITSMMHYRLMLLGFLGFTILGVLFQFYPPGIGTLPGVSDRTAAGSIGAIVTGLAIELTGLAIEGGLLVDTGRLLALLGGIGVAWIIGGLTYQQRS